ncbi:hypothetical protein [Caballeronia sp. S22]|uniref:hypothetical protein n=1 Tax=Caballeronia sp. S22 TaxID=3137182 RepID=UPI003531422C
MSSEIDAVTLNRFEDAPMIQQGASNPIGVTRALQRAINACHRESLSASEDPAVRLIVHQLAYICGVHAIDHDPDVYSQLSTACTGRSTAIKQARQTVALAAQPTA